MICDFCLRDAPHDLMGVDDVVRARLRQFPPGLGHLIRQRLEVLPVGLGCALLIFYPVQHDAIIPTHLQLRPAVRIRREKRFADHGITLAAITTASADRSAGKTKRTKVSHPCPADFSSRLSRASAPRFGALPPVIQFSCSVTVTSRPPMRFLLSAKASSCALCRCSDI